MNKYLVKIASFKEMAGKEKAMKEGAVKSLAKPVSKLPMALTAGIGGAALIGTGFWQKHMQHQQNQDQQQKPTDRPEQGLTN